MKKILITVLILNFVLCGCVNDNTTSENTTEINVFAAASLEGAISEIADKYSENNNVKININADSSGTLLTQIEEGYECDIFFPAATKQMEQLEAEGLAEEGTRKDLLNNQLVVVTQKDSSTNVTGLENIEYAQSIALAGGSVPAGRYTREALINIGKLEYTEDPSLITTDEVSKALGGVEISEQSNVSKVLIAVAEGACEVGTTYYSDTYGFEDKVKIIEKVDTSLTGDVIYPVCLVKNTEADNEQKMAAEDFINYLETDEAGEVFQKYYFTKIG